MQNVFDYNQQADQSLMGGARAERALGIPVQRGLPGSFAPGSSNAQADSLLAEMEQGTQDMLAARTKPQRPPVVGYNPDTEEVFSGGKTFKLDLDQGAANAALLDMDNTDLPPGFTAVYGDSVKQKLVKEYEGLGLVDAFQRRAGQAVGNIGSTLQDAGMDGVGQSMQEWGGSVARSNPSHINTARDLMASPGQAATEAVGEIAYDVPMAIAQTAVGAKIGAVAGAALAPFTGGATIPIGAFLGGAAGRFIGTLAETYGSVRSEQREAGIDNKGRALAAGSGSAALEALLGPEAAAGNILGRAITGQVARRTTGEAARLTGQGMLKYGAKQAGIGAVVEGPLTEVPQSAIERWGAEKDLTGDSAVDEYAIGAFKGAVGGAAASPLASVPEFMQAKNFIANLQEDMQIAANPQTPSGQRVAAARRAQDVLRGSSEDPLFNEQLQEFRQKLQYIDTLIVDNSTKEAIANGEAVNLLDLAPQRDLFARGDTTVQQPPAPEPEEPIGVAQPGQDELFGEGGAPTYGADTSFGVSPFEREQTFEGPRLTPEQRVVAGLPALNEIMDQIQTGTLPRAVSDDLTPGQQAALAGPARPVSGALTPGQQVAAAGPDPMTGFQRALQGVTLDLEAPAAPTPVATVVSSPLQGDLSAANEPAAGSFTDDDTDEEVSPDEDLGDIEAELDKVLKAQAASTPGQAKGRVTLPQPVLGAVIRAVRSGRSPVVYRKGTATPDAALTGEWSDKMRELTDRIAAVSTAADKLLNRESNVVPGESDATGKKQGGRALTGADVEKTTIVASDAEADINRLRAALRTAIDNLRSGAGDMDIEALAAVLKTRVQEVRSKDAAKAKADTKLDTTFSRAWAMYKDGALDNIEQADVVRGRAIRESFEQKRKGATNPPLVDAAVEGETRRQMRPRKGEATKEFKARVEAAKEKGVLGMLAYLQRHGTAFERLLAASTGRALRRFSGTAAEPKFDWVDTDIAAYYDPKTNTVHVHKEASPEEILHETLHSALQWYVYQNPDVAEVKMLMQALDKVLAMDPAKFSPKAAEVVAVLRRVAKGKSKTARLDAVLELVSYGSTLAEFRNALKQISSVQDADAGTMSGLTAIWQRLTALIQRFLGVSNTVANDVLDGTVALLEMAADPGIDAPGARKGNILKADVMSAGGTVDVDGMSPKQAAQNPGAAPMSTIDFKRFSKTILPGWVSTKAAFDFIGWGKLVTAADAKVVTKLNDWVQGNSPGLTKAVSWVNSHYALPSAGKEALVGALTKSKDLRRGGSGVYEDLASYFTTLPPAQNKAVLEYMDARLRAIRSKGKKPVFPSQDRKLQLLADATVDGWWTMATAEADPKIRAAMAGTPNKDGTWTGGMDLTRSIVFPAGVKQLASRSFGARNVGQLVITRAKKEVNDDAVRFAVNADNDPILTGNFIGVYSVTPALQARLDRGELLAEIQPDEFIAESLYNAGKLEAGYRADPDYSWALKTLDKGKGYVFTGRLDPLSAKATQDGARLAHALQNTMAIMANSYSATTLATDLVSMGREDGTVTPTVVVYDTLDQLNSTLNGTYDEDGTFTPETDSTKWTTRVKQDQVLSISADEAKSETARSIYRSRKQWVRIPNGTTYGAMGGKIVNGAVWSAIEDMSDRRPLVNSTTYNGLMRWFKGAKTKYNPATWGTNVASNVTMAMMDDIPMATLAHAARLYALYHVAPGRLSAAEVELMVKIKNTNALLGDFSSNEIKQSLYDAMKSSIDDREAGIPERIMQFFNIEKKRTESLKALAGRGADAAKKFDDYAAAWYSAQDNVFRVASMLNQLGQAADAGKEMNDETFRLSGDHARFAFLDYDIDSKAVRIMRQTAFPFISWPYAAAKLIGNIAVHRPWKLVNLYAGYWMIEAVMQAIAGDDDDEDAAKRKVGPEWARERLLMGFGPHAALRVPFLGDDKNPVYYNAGKYVVPSSFGDRVPNGFMGLDWWPSFITPGGPFISTAVAVIGGVDPFNAKPLAPPTASSWEAASARLKFTQSLFVPNLPYVNLRELEKFDEVIAGRTDKTDNHAALYFARLAGLRMYDYNVDQSAVAQSRAAKAIMSEYKQEIGRLRRAEARYERPDWERFAKKQTELLKRMQEEISELRGE